MVLNAQEEVAACKRKRSEVEDYIDLNIDQIIYVDKLVIFRKH